MKIAGDLSTMAPMPVKVSRHLFEYEGQPLVLQVGKSSFALDWNRSLPQVALSLGGVLVPSQCNDRTNQRTFINPKT